MHLGLLICMGKLNAYFKQEVANLAPLMRCAGKVFDDG